MTILHHSKTKLILLTRKEMFCEYREKVPACRKARLQFVLRPNEIIVGNEM